MEQAMVNFTAITEGLSVELGEADQKHLMEMLMVGENTSASAQALRKAKVLAEAPKAESATSIGNRYLQLVNAEAKA